MDETLKISIIVPVFNMEKYLHRCIDSILNQSYRNFELILINDGSTDTSAEICDSYKKKDKRVIVVHQENQGVSAARNKGLEICCGEWVCFVDADDYISNNYLLAIIGSHADIMFVEFIIVSSSQEQSHGYCIPEQIVERKDIKQFLGQNALKQPLRTPWAKFYRKSCIGNTRFIAGQRLGEDTVFDYTVFRSCNSFEVRHGFFYYIQQGELGEVNDFVKYRMSAADAALCLSNIYHAYKDLSIETTQKFWFFEYFFKMCDKRWGHSCAAWFSNPIVQELEKIILADYTYKERVAYRMWRYPYIGNIAELYWQLRTILKV